MIVCRTNQSAESQAQNGRRKRAWSSKEASSIRKAATQRQELLEQLKQTHADVEAQALVDNAVSVEGRLHEFQQLTAELVTLLPNESIKLDSYMAKWFGMNKTLGGLGDNLTKSGSVRKAIVDAQRMAGGMVESAGKWQTLGKLRRMEKEFRTITKRYGISGRQADELFVSTVEIGQNVRARAAYGNTDAVNTFLDNRYRKWYDSVQGSGFNDAEINKLVELSLVASNASDEVRAVANALGVDVGNVENMGYFTRSLQEDAAMTLDVKLDTPNNEFKRLGIGNTVYAKSRSTWQLIPEDYTTLGEMLGKTETELDELFQEPLQFLDHMHKNLSGEQIDALVDAGIMSKVPMTTREVFDYFVKQYELPYTKMSDMFKTNPVEALQGYTNSLRRATGDSAIFKRLMTDGTRSGWVVSKAAVFSDPTTYKGFKDMSGIDLASFGVSPEDAESFRGGFVHPIVYDQLEAVVNMSSSPGKLHEVAQVLQYMQRVLLKSVLTNVAYVGRIALGNTIQFAAAGGHIQRVIPATVDVLKVMRNGLDALDDTKPFLEDNGKFITKREAFRKFMIGRGSDFAPLQSGERLGDNFSGFDAIKPWNAPKAFGEVLDYARLFGDPVSGLKAGINMTGKKVENIVDVLHAPFAIGANALDLFFKWALVQSTMKVSGVSDVFRQANQLISGKHYSKSMLDAFDHIDNYFVDYANLGTFQKTYGRLVRPFASYALMNPPMQLRHAMRNPSRFMSYMRLYSFVNKMGDNPNITEAGFSENELDDMPVNIMYDPATKQAITMFTANFDPIADALVFTKELGESVQRLGGNNVGSGFERRSDLTTPYTLRQFTNEMVGKNTNEFFKTVSELISGRDTFSGREIDKTKRDLFGVQMSGDAAWILSKFPFISKMDAMLGGRGKVINASGVEVAPAEPGLFGTPQRPATPSEKSRYYTEQRLGEFGVVLREVIGVKVKTIDIAENNQYTLSDIQQAGVDLSKAISTKEKTVRENRTEQGIAELEVMRGQYINLLVDSQRVKDWMKLNNVPDKDALNKLKDLGIMVRTLPIESAVIEQFVQQQVKAQELAVDGNK